MLVDRIIQYSNLVFYQLVNVRLLISGKNELTVIISNKINELLRNYHNNTVAVISPNSSTIESTFEGGLKTH